MSPAEGWSYGARVVAAIKHAPHTIQGKKRKERKRKNEKRVTSAGKAENVTEEKGVGCKGAEGVQLERDGWAGQAEIGTESAEVRPVPSTVSKKKKDWKLKIKKN